jgi:hypothetical protein
LSKARPVYGVGTTSSKPLGIRGGDKVTTHRRGAVTDIGYVSRQALDPTGRDAHDLTFGNPVEGQFGRSV